MECTGSDGQAEDGTRRPGAARSLQVSPTRRAGEGEHELARRGGQVKTAAVLVVRFCDLLYYYLHLFLSAAAAAALKVVAEFYFICTNTFVCVRFCRLGRVCAFRWSQTQAGVHIYYVSFLLL